MNLSGQLRIILLLIGAVTLWAIYFFGKRRSTEATPRAEVLHANGSPMTEAELAQDNEQPELDEDALDTPAYMRRQPHHEVQFEEPLEDLPEMQAEGAYSMTATEVRYQPEAVPVQAEPPEAQIASVTHDEVEAQPQAPTFVMNDEPDSAQSDEPVFAHDDLDKFQMGDMQFTAQLDEPVLERVSDARFATAVTDEFENWPMPEHAQASSSSHSLREADEPTIPSISEVVAPAAKPLRAGAAYDTSINVQTPTLSESVEVPPPARPATPARSAEKPADKTVSPAARRKIVALRLAMPEGAPGSQLQALLHVERLEFGRFSIFHRMQGTGTVFSVASMVEPGTFDPVQMPQQQIPGITLFMLLPGPLDGLIAYDQMLTCAQRITHATNGILQDERGNKLTPQFMERLREEVLDFQHLVGTLPTSH